MSDLREFDEIMNMDIGGMRLIRDWILDNESPVDVIKMHPIDDNDCIVSSGVDWELFTSQVRQSSMYGMRNYGIEGNPVYDEDDIVRRLGV